MPKLRLASALLITGPLSDEIDGLRRACGDSMLGRVDPHVTLVEPINVREDALPDIERLMRAAAAVVDGPLTLTLGPARSFHPESPVLYLAVGGDLDSLVAVRAAMRTGPFAREAAFPFVPHVTIGTDLSEARLAAGVEALGGYAVTVTLTHLQVLQEHRDPDEVRRWRPIADAAIGGRVVSGRGGIELEITESIGAAFTLTARHDGAPVGGLRGWVDGAVARLGWLQVAEGARGLGVGRGLLAAFEKLARDRGATSLVTSTADGVVDFLRSRGWHDEGDAMVRDL